MDSRLRGKDNKNILIIINLPFLKDTFPFTHCQLHVKICIQYHQISIFINFN